MNFNKSNRPFRYIHNGTGSFGGKPFVAVLFAMKNINTNFLSLFNQPTETQKSGADSVKLIPTSCPIECAASMTLQILSSLHIATISFQGNVTPGQETILSMTATRFLLGLAGLAWI